MAKLPRTTQKIFGKNAPENQITTFGSIKAGTPVYTQSASQIMNSAFEGGWSEAVEDDYAPYRQDRNAVDTAITQQLAYLFQEGIPEWDAGTTYYKGSVVKIVNGNALTFYKSIADNNTSSVNTTASWHKMLDINASNQIVSPTINTPIISGGSMSNGTFSDPTFSGTVNVPLASQSSSTDSTIAASIGWVNNPSLSSNVLHKTGNESASGIKGFNVITIGDTSEYKVALYKTSSGDLGIAMYDQNNSALLSSIVISKDGSISLQPSTYITAPTPATSDNSTKVSTTAYVKAQGYSTTDTKNTAGSTDTSSKIFLIGATSQATNPQTYSHDTVYVNASGQLVSSTPASSTNSTVVATTAFVKNVLSSSGNGLATYSKAKNGYYKFANGLIIQWGEVASGTAEVTVTLPTAFTNKNYQLSAQQVADNNLEYLAPNVGGKQTTTFNLITRGGAVNVPKSWIAVGY